MYIHLTQFVAVFTATLSSISDGMQFGWCSPTVPKLMAKDSPIPITKAEAEWLDSIYMIGCILALLLIFYFSDKIGRKHSVLSASVICLISWLLIIFGQSVEYFYVARFIAGFGSNINFICMSMYIGEIAHSSIRGFLMSFIHIMILSGIILVYTIAPLLQIYTTALVGICFPILQLISFAMIPESPYYLILIGEEEKAEKALSFFRGFNDIDQELRDIKEAIIRDQSNKGSLKDMFLIASNRKVLIIATFMNASKHLGAFSVILMNLHTILKDVQDIVTTYQAGIIFSIIMLISSTMSSALMDYCGRKILIILSSITTATLLFIIAIYFHLNKYNLTSGYSWIPAAAVVLYAASFELGIGLVPSVLNAELFPTSLKAIGLTLSDIFYVGFSIISLNLYHILVDNYGFHTPFYIFGVWCIFVAIFTVIYIPETKGRTLEEIQMLLKGNNKKI